MMLDCSLNLMINLDFPFGKKKERSEIISDGVLCNGYAILTSVLLKSMEEIVTRHGEFGVNISNSSPDLPEYVCVCILSANDSYDAQSIAR